MRFSDLLHYVLKREGGYANDPDDPGHGTNCGITQATYDRWRESQHLQARDVRQLTPDETFSIYDTEYWAVVQGDALLAVDANVALQVFDMAVNAGCDRAVRLLQRCLHLGESGQMDGACLDELRRADLPSLREAYAAQREQYYRAIVARRPQSQKFLAGWLKRVAIIRGSV